MGGEIEVATEWWADPAWWAVIISAAVAIIGGGVWIHRWASKHDQKHQSLEGVPGQLTNIESDVRAVRETVSILAVHAQTKDPNFINQLKAAGKSGGNPYNPQRRAELIEKYQQGSISFEEAQELRDMLGEDVATAATAVTTSGLVGLSALVYVLGLHKREDLKNPPPPVLHDSSVRVRGSKRRKKASSQK